MGESGFNRYYEDFVIRGSVNGVDAFAQNASSFNDFQNSLETKLVREISAAGVPEPSSVMLSCMDFGGLLVRRKRNC